MLEYTKFDELKKKLEAIKSTVESSAPQVNKNRRINSLVEMALDLIKEVSNGV